MKKIIRLLLLLLLALPALADDSALYVRKVRAFSKDDKNRTIMIEVQVVNRGKEAGDATVNVNLVPRNHRDLAQKEDSITTINALEPTEVSESILGLAPGASKTVLLKTDYKAASKFETSNIEFEALHPGAGKQSRTIKIKYKVSVGAY